MPSVGERLANVCPAETFLRRSCGVDFQKHSTSAQSLVRSFHEEAAPRCVMYGLGKHSARQPFDVQILNKDRAVAVNDLPTFLVLKVIPLIANFRMNLLDGFLCLPSGLTSTLPSSQHLLSMRRLVFRRFKEARVLNLFTVRENRKCSQPDVDPNRVIQRGQDSVFDDAGEAGVIFARLADDGNGFDFAFNGAMKLDFDLTSALNAKLSIVHQSATVAVGRESHAVIPVARFESRKACFALAFLTSAKECFERFIDSAQYILAAREIFKRRIAFGADLFQLIRLIVVVDRNMTNAVGVPALLKRRIVEPTSFCELSIKELALLFRREQSVFERLLHLLGLLVCDVLFDRRFRNMSNASDVIRTTPQRRKATFEPRKFISENFRSEALELSGDVSRRKRRIRFNKHVNVIRHYFQGMNLRIQLSGFLIEKFFQSLRNVAAKDALSIFWTPH